MGIPANSHVCYELPAHCAVVVEESASLTLDFKEDAMLIGFTLAIVAVYMCCTLLFRLSVHALPLFVGFAAASVTYHSDHGLVAALVAAALAGIATIALAQIALGLARTEFSRAIIGFAFALPAALAGYHAVHGIAAATMPVSIWPTVVAVIGGAMIAATSWARWSRSAR